MDLSDDQWRTLVNPIFKKLAHRLRLFKRLIQAQVWPQVLRRKVQLPHTTLYSQSKDGGLEDYVTDGPCLAFSC